MSEEAQPTAPAAPSAPAAGETSTQAPAEQNTQGQTPANTNTAEPPKQPQQQAAGEGEDGGDDEERGKRPSRSQRLQRKAQMLAAENEDLRRRLSGGERPAQQDAPQQRQDGAAEDKEPQEADFAGDWFKYQAALQAFHVRKAARDAVRGEAERVRTERAATERAAFIKEAVLDYREQADELRERIPEYDALHKQGLPFKLTDELTVALLESDKSALLELHLIKNPDKARELNGLTGPALARAIGRLEGAVRLPAAKKATDASPPLKPLDGGGAKPSFDPFKAEMDEFASHWNARETAKREARFK